LIQKLFHYIKYQFFFEKKASIFFTLVLAIGTVSFAAVISLIFRFLFKPFVYVFITEVTVLAVARVEPRFGFCGVFSFSDAF